MFSTSGSGGYLEYIGGCLVHERNIMIHVGEYHEYIRGCSVHQRDTVSTSGDIMIHVGEQIDKSL